MNRKQTEICASCKSERYVNYDVVKIWRHQYNFTEKLAVNDIRRPNEKLSNHCNLLPPWRVFICATASRRMVSLSGLRARVLQDGTMSHSSLTYVAIFVRRRRSISQWDSLQTQKKSYAQLINDRNYCSQKNTKPMKSGQYGTAFDFSAPFSKRCIPVTFTSWTRELERISKIWPNQI